MKFRNLFIHIALVALIFNASLPLAAQNAAQNSPASTKTNNLPPNVERVAAVEGITEYNLKSNGLKILLVPDQTEQTVTVNVTYLVGSRHENYGETGMAHLLEHLLFKGSPKFPKIPQALTERGARFNGTTSEDRTNYFETLNASDENLRFALELEADRMVNSFVSKKDLDTEMTVVRNEFERNENNSARILLERVNSTAYLWHNYGNTTIGSRADIENVPIERLQNFYKTYYQPDNAVLIVAGKFDEAKTLQMIAEIYGAIPRPTRALPKFYTQEPTQDGARFVALERAGGVQNLLVAYRVPDFANADSAALTILSDIIGNPAGGRLKKALVDTGKATSVGSFPSGYADPGLIYFNAFVRRDAAIEPARDALLQTIEKFAAEPPSAEEVERARTALLNFREQTQRNTARFATELSQWIARGDWRLFFLDRDRLKKVTPADVQQAAQKYLKESNRTLGIFTPTDKPNRAEIPAKTDVAAIVKDYRSDASVAAGEAFDYSPANIEARTTRGELQPGGIRYAFVPKKTRGGMASVTLTLPFGNEQTLMNRSAVAALTGALLSRGTIKRTRQQIQDEMNKLKARISVAGGSARAGASIQAPRENVGAAMRLAAEMLRQPAFSPKELEEARQQLISAAEFERSDPANVAGGFLARNVFKYPKGHVYYRPAPDERIAELKSVTLDDVKKFYADFYGASYGTLAAVGDFDPQELIALSGELFGDWKNKTPYERVPLKYFEVSGINQTLEMPDKTNAVFTARLNLNMRDDDSDYPALLLGNYILGGAGLSSRLATRIRQKEGLSYSVGSQLGASAQDNSGFFSASAIAAPQNISRVEAAFKEEIARALKDGFTAEEVQTAKSSWLEARRQQSANDDFILTLLAQQLELNRTPSWGAKLEEKVSALTPEQILAAMRRRIDPNKISIAKAGDFSKVNGGAAKNEVNK
jgi:zinc protease